MSSCSLSQHIATDLSCHFMADSRDCLIHVQNFSQVTHHGASTMLKLCIDLWRRNNWTSVFFFFFLKFSSWKVTCLHFPTFFSHLVCPTYQLDPGVPFSNMARRNIWTPPFFQDPKDVTTGRPCISLDPARMRSNEGATENFSEGVAGNCNGEGIPEWLEDFTESLEIAVTQIRNVLSKWHHGSTVFLRTLPEDQNCEVCKLTKITRAPCRKKNWKFSTSSREVR